MSVLVLVSKLDICGRFVVKRLVCHYEGDDVLVISVNCSIGGRGLDIVRGTRHKRIAKAASAAVIVGVQIDRGKLILCVHCKQVGSIDPVLCKNAEGVRLHYSTADIVSSLKIIFSYGKLCAGVIGIY